MRTIRLTVAAGALFCAGCAHTPEAWNRIDGLPIAPAQIQADNLACKGEAAKANLAAGRQAAIHTEIFGYSGGMMAVYQGCMADHGYLPDTADSK